MTTAVVSVDRGTPFKEIVRVLRQRNVSAVPVNRADGVVVGVVSEADLLPKEEFRDSDPSRLTQLRRPAAPPLRAYREVPSARARHRCR